MAGWTLPGWYTPPAVGQIDPQWQRRGDTSVCWEPVGRNQIPDDTPGGYPEHVRDVVCTLPRGHDPRYHVAHGSNGIVLAVLGEADPNLWLPEGL